MAKHIPGLKVHNGRALPWHEQGPRLSFCHWGKLPISNCRKYNSEKLSDRSKAHFSAWIDWTPIYLSGASDLSLVTYSQVHWFPPANTYQTQAVYQPWWQTLAIIITEGSHPEAGDHLVNEGQKLTVVLRKLWKDRAMRIWGDDSLVAEGQHPTEPQTTSSLLSSCLISNQWWHYPSAKIQ